MTDDNYRDPEQEEAAPEPQAEPVDPLGTYEVVDRFMGGPSEEEQQRRAEEEKREKFLSGETVHEVAEHQRRYSQVLDHVKERYPGISSPAAIREMTPLWNAVAEEIGIENASDPMVLQQVFEEVGGSARFAPDPAEERWKSIVPQGAKDSVFTR